MKKIDKGKEPNELHLHRTTPGADFESLKKQTVRDSLVAEQRGICCYCMARIQPAHDKMKIEHFACQEDNENLSLIYSNMLGACRGNDQKGVPEERHHCDTKKKALSLTFNPSNPALDVSTLIEYGADGTISSTDERLERELNEVLNLNLSFLKTRRKSTLSALSVTLPKKGKVPKATWQKHLRKFSGEGTDTLLKPYCEVVCYYLRKKIAAM